MEDRVLLVTAVVAALVAVVGVLLVLVVVVRGGGAGGRAPSRSPRPGTVPAAQGGSGGQVHSPPAPATAPVAAPRPASGAGVGSSEERDRLLLGARSEAEQVVAAARSEAEGLRAKAEQVTAAALAEAARLRDEAAAAVEQLREAVARDARDDAAREAAQVREAALLAAAATREEALRSAAAERDAALREAAGLREDALRDAAGVREAAARETAELRAAADRDATRTREGADAEVARRLEELSGLDATSAREELVRRLTTEAERAGAASVRRAEAAARRTAQARALRVVTTAVQRLAVPTSREVSVVTLTLPAPELKGRIIGKEGRNIRTFEALTGVNVLVDETPGVVVLSCFDPERREVAQIALEALLLDGRITPPRIEAAYAEALAGADERAEAAGHDAAERAGVTGLHPELVRTLGRLRLRTSYGQNVLEHLVESALLAATMAGEVGADVTVARRGAFLHDVGKALTGEVPGTHAVVGAALVRRCDEGEDVANAVEAHHDEVPARTVEAVLVQAADAISAARPGARHDELDQLVERLGRLEALVSEHSGVRRVLAMSAGREVRVLVEPSEVDDAAMHPLAEAVARHIEEELTYPGEIKVTVVRELRASATAG
ncbi:ribonuclease Y [Cellulomonas endophytica]|uniref:ribonuclease Y n=1 Tax=Cellulomonas endophytica TaxID=2494735 RepID=UPI001F0C84C3|nr:ribonuclease Y [Cellulomonas endophytica]